MVRGSAAQTVDGKLRVREPPFFSIFPLIDATLRAHISGSIVWFSSGTPSCNHCHRPVGRFGFGHWLLWVGVVLHVLVCVRGVPFEC